MIRAVYIKSNIFPSYPRQSPTGSASTTNISRVMHGKNMLAVPCQNDKNTESHCAVEDIDYCLHEYFSTPRQPRHQGPLDFSIFWG